MSTIIGVYDTWGEADLARQALPAGEFAWIRKERISVWAEWTYVLETE